MCQLGWKICGVQSFNRKCKLKPETLFATVVPTKSDSDACFVYNFLVKH